MSITVTYDHKAKKARILKGKIHNGRPQRWTIAAKYQTNKGPRSLTLRPDEACNLSGLSDLLARIVRQDLVNEEAEILGDIQWTAMSR